VIEVENLTKDYGPHRAIDDVSFRVEKGEILGLLGPNGAGKTTMMRILTCFFPPTKGRALVAGFDCFEDSLKVRQKIGYLPERVPLYDDMKVRDYLAFVSGMKGVRSGEVGRCVARVTDDFDLAEVSDRLVGTLSRGYRQRVGLAQAVVNDPEVLILDEPTVGLDPKQIREIRKLIKELAGKHTVILSTHILPEVTLLCGRVAIINQGKLVAVDEPDKLASANSPRLFLRVAGAADEVERELRTLDGVTSVDREQGGVEEANGFVVEFDDAQPVRKDIQAMVVHHDWDLVEMRPIGVTLEDIFIKLVTKEEA